MEVKGLNGALRVDVGALRSLDGFRLDQFLGIWGVEPQRFGQLVHQVGQMDLLGHYRLQSADPERFRAEMTPQVEARGRGERPERSDDSYIKVISINGTITKYGSSLSGAGAVAYKQEIRQAARDPYCQSIVLRIDSPGGSVSYIDELASEVAAAAKQKKVVAVCEDNCMSAAYWVASQATEVVANSETANVGSIGVFMALVDASKYAESEGLRVVVVKAGQFKGVGIPGVAITAEHEEYLQGLVEAVYEQFVSQVARGRGVSSEVVSGWADGRVYTAKDGVSMGLVDSIETLDEVIGRLQAESPRKEAKAMSGENTVKTDEGVAERAATAKELKAAFPRASDGFRLDCLEDECTMAQARERYSRHLEEENARLASEAAEAAKARESAEAEASAKAKEQAASDGVDPVSYAGVRGGASTGDGDPASEFEALVSAKVSAGMPRHQAHAAVCRENPALRAAWVAQHNALHKQQAVQA